MELAVPTGAIALAATQFFLVFVRTGAMVFFLPGFGENYVPARVKLVLAFALAALVFPLIGPQIPVDPLSQNQVFRLIGTEAIIGVFWGAVIRLIIHVLQMAGAIISQATSLAQIFGGTVNMDAQPAMGHIMVVSGLALISLLGLHETYLVYILNTYNVTPAGMLLPGSAVAEYSSGHISKAFSLAFQLSAAALTATLLYNIVLGVINRAMPQLLVSFVGAPAITAGGLLLLYLMAPTMLDVWLRFVADIIAIDGIV